MKCQQSQVSIKSVKDLASLITCPFLGGKTDITSRQEGEMLGLYTSG